MQANLLVGPIPINGSHSFSSSSPINAKPSIFPVHWHRLLHYRKRNLRSRHNRRRQVPVAASSSSSSPATINGEQNHYAILGVTRNATSADIKKAYRLLARKFHPDVSKDSRAGELFKRIHCAYEVLTNEVTRIQYDRALRYQEDARSYRARRNYNAEFEDRERIYRWAEMRQKMQYGRYQEHHNVKEENSSFYDESDEETEEEILNQERGSFIEVLKSAFVSLFLLQTFGCLLSLTYSCLMALFDKKLDAGYKIGYVIAWILGGRGGIVLTLCLSFASWVCGKTSSSLVVLVVVAMWVGSNLARYAPLPQGALLTLVYMSIKLQVDLN